MCTLVLLYHFHYNSLISNVLLDHCKKLSFESTMHFLGGYQKMLKIPKHQKDIRDNGKILGYIFQSQKNKSSKILPLSPIFKHKQPIFDNSDRISEIGNFWTKSKYLTYAHNTFPLFQYPRNSQENSGKFVFAQSYNH